MIALGFNKWSLASCCVMTFLAWILRLGRLELAANCRYCSVKSDESTMPHNYAREEFPNDQTVDMPVSTRSTWTAADLRTSELVFVLRDLSWIRSR